MRGKLAVPGENRVLYSVTADFTFRRKYLLVTPGFALRTDLIEDKSV